VQLSEPQLSSIWIMMAGSTFFAIIAIKRLMKQDLSNARIVKWKMSCLFSSM